jgi:hypothetical protein
MVLHFWSRSADITKAKAKAKAFNVYNFFSCDNSSTIFKGNNLQEDESVSAHPKAIVLSKNCFL